MLRATQLPGNDLPGDIVAMLLRVEHVPAIMEWVRRLGPEQATHLRVAVRNVEPGDLVVAVVLEAVASGAPRRINRCRGIAPQRENAHRLIRRVAVVQPYVEEIRGIEGVALRMQGVTRVLDEDDLVIGPEGHVVEAAVCLITLIEQREEAVIRRGRGLAQLEHGPEAAEIRGFGEGVGVSGCIEE